MDDPHPLKGGPDRPSIGLSSDMAKNTKTAIWPKACRDPPRVFLTPTWHP